MLCLCVQFTHKKQVNKWNDFNVTVIGGRRSVCMQNMLTRWKRFSPYVESMPSAFQSIELLFSIHFLLLFFFFYFHRQFSLLFSVFCLRQSIDIRHHFSRLVDECLQHISILFWALCSLTDFSVLVKRVNGKYLFIAATQFSTSAFYLSVVAVRHSNINNEIHTREQRFINSSICKFYWKFTLFVLWTALVDGQLTFCFAWKSVTRSIWPFVIRKLENVNAKNLKQWTMFSLLQFYRLVIWFVRLSHTRIYMRKWLAGEWE